MDVSKLKQLGLGLCLAILSVAMMMGSASALIKDVHGQLHLLDMNYSVTTLSTHHAYLPGVILGGIAIAIAIVARVLQTEKPALYQRLIRASSVMMASGLVVAFGGAILIKGLWSSAMDERGYARCSERELRIVSRLDRSVWATDPSYCTHRIVVRTLRRANEEELKQIHQLLLRSK